MAAVEAMLAALGVLFAILMVRVAFEAEAPPAPVATEDLAAPYREGLHAAVRMQKVAADLERQIYAEAAQRFDGSRAGES